MSKQRHPTICIVYCATSGFNPTADVILECCTILVDATTLDVVDTANVLVQQPGDPPNGCPDFHATLLAECVQSENAVRLSQLEGFLLAGPWSSAGAICCRALDFQQKFLAHHMPAFTKACRWMLPIELKSLELLGLARGAAPFQRSVPKTYRAADEACAAYEELCHWTTNK